MAAVTGAYNVIRAAVTTSTAITVIQVLAPAASAIEITRCWTNQSDTTTTNQTRIQLNKNSTACTVTSATPAPLQTGMQASKCVGGTAATGITASAEGTVTNTLWSEGFNIVNGILYLPVPEARALVVGSSTGFVGVKFPSAPASAAYTSGIEFLEYAA